MKAITTTYKGPTNTRGSRLIASDEDGNRVSVPYDHALNSEGNHQAAAQKLKNKMGWKGEMVGGGTKKGMVWVFVEGTPRINPIRRNMTEQEKFYVKMFLNEGLSQRAAESAAREYAPHAHLPAIQSNKYYQRALRKRIPSNPAPRRNPRNINYSDGSTAKHAVVEIWNDNHTERRGNWYRAYWVSPGASTGSPVFGYASGQGGPHRTVYAAAAEVWRYYPGEEVYREGRRIVQKNPAPRIGTRNVRRRSQATGRAPSRRLINRRTRNSHKGFFPNPRDAARLQRKAYADSGIHIDIGSHNMKRNPRKKRRTVHRKRHSISAPSQFAGLPYLLKLRGSVVAGFKALPRAKQYARKLSRHERAPVGIFKR